MIINESAIKPRYPDILLPGLDMRGREGGGAEEKEEGGGGLSWDYLEK